MPCPVYLSYCNRSLAFGRNSFPASRWFNVLGDCLAQSEVKLDDFPPEMFQKGIAEYEEMGSSQRLKLLNFLCDETLSTTVLRDCLANPESVERKKEAKEKLNAAKANEQKLYQKLEDEFSKAQAENNGVEGLYFIIAFAEIQEYDDVLRTSPVELDDNGLTLWKLKSYNKEPNILLQDLGSWSDVCPHERVLRDCFANPESVDKKKEAKEKLNAAKANEQKLYQKIEDEFSKAQAEKNGVELTIKQRLANVSQMEAESELVFAGMQNALKMQKVQEYDDVLRTSPVELDDNGLTLWKLKSYNKEPNILIQDLGSWSDVCPHERWFAFSPEQKPQVEKYIACKKVDL
ncbi:hypothetical protein F2Q69_00048489 [Brassica cretica]|uniref:WHIM1 domain-containing protein n=1 Tax=Brassica cretica TaxID=69181 RepID=A0A8S9PZ05_BRACR|nr:hypothetical protein F2Q69_00048489 [Brassica cretica]